MNTQQRAVVQQALEAFEKLYLTEDDEWARDYVRAQATALRQLLEQPEQGHDHALEQALTRLQKRYSELEAKVEAQPEPVQGPYSAPIKHLWNAAPKPATWVGLTAKDLAEIPPSAYEGAIWADAKLREKNGGA